MNKITAFLIFITIGFFSCKNSEKESDKLEIAKKFYIAIDNSNPLEMNKLITEKFTTIDDGFKQEYNRNEYVEWVKWDSVFQPNYEILKIEKENGIIKAKISKIDKRISFLHHAPIVTDEILQFEDNKIKNISRTSASFNVVEFIKNRDEFVKWISEKQPELNGFLNDQTKSGGMNYLKAIDLYENQK